MCKFKVGKIFYKKVQKKEMFNRYFTLVAPEEKKVFLIPKIRMIYILERDPTSIFKKMYYVVP